MNTADKPSKYYADACGTLTIRLSELIFGSLVAAYILAFIATSDIAGSAGIISSVGRLAICITFAYLTTALYLHYHCGLLTMPTMALERAGLDFSFALGQGVFFCICMIRPAFFPTCVSVALLVSFFRQHVEYDHLVDFLADISRKTTGTGPSNPRHHGNIGVERRVKAAGLLSTYCGTGGISGWAPVSRWTVFFASALLLVGGLYAVEDVGAYLGRPLPQLDGRIPSCIPVFADLPIRAVVTAVGAWLLCTFVVIKAQRILRHAGELLSGDGLGKMDDQYAELVSKLQSMADDAPVA